MKNKICSKCERDLPLTNDYFEKRKESRDGFRGVCRECRGKHFLIKDTSLDYIESKICKTCKELKSIDSFQPRKSSVDGYCNMCNLCRMKKNNGYDEKTNTKLCKKCNNRLEVTEEYFKKDELCFDGFRNVCRVCSGGEYGESREYKRWSEEEINILINNYPYFSNEDLNSMFFPHRSVDNMRNKANELGLVKDKESMARRYWTEEQEQYLIDNYASIDTNELVRVIGKDASTIRARAIKLGIKKDIYWSEEEIQVLIEKYPFYKTEDLVSKYFPDRSLHSINCKVQDLNLKKDKEHLIKTREKVARENIKKAQFVNIDGKLVKVKGSLSPVYKERISVNCHTCGKELEVLKSRFNNQTNLFCSRECSAKWKSENMSGENSPLFGKVSSYWNEEARREKAKAQIEHLINSDFSFRKTKPQLIVDDILRRKEIDFEEEYNCKYYLVDNYLKESNLMIEVQGNFFHCNPTMNINNSRRNKILHKDKSKHTYIKNKYGIEILYLWEYDINNRLELCEKLIELYIENNGELEDYHSFNYTINSNGNIELIENKYNVGY